MEGKLIYAEIAFMSGRDSELPHKLLITGILKPPSPYKKFLSKDETVTGKVTEFAIKIKNIGDKLIPQGSVELKMEKPTGMGTFELYPKPVETPVIKPNKTFNMRWKGALIAPGLWLVTLTAKLKEKEKIEYYRSATAIPTFDSWLWAFYVVDRHQLDLNNLLEKLLEKKEE